MGVFIGLFIGFSLILLFQHFHVVLNYFFKPKQKTFDEKLNSVVLKRSKK
jgi:hypothetical protein